MRKIYEAALLAVCEAFGLNEHQVIKGRTEYCVEARGILIHVLGQRMRDEEIFLLTGLPKSSVNYIRNSFLKKRKMVSICEKLNYVLGEMERCSAWNLVM